MKHKTLYFLFLVFPAFFISGCQHITLKGDGVPNKHYQETIHSSYYGFYWNDYKEIKASNNEGLYRIRICDNYAYSLIGILTLGIYKPLDVEYWTTKQIIEKSNEKEWIPSESD